VKLSRQILKLTHWRKGVLLICEYKHFHACSYIHIYILKCNQALATVNHILQESRWLYFKKNFASLIHQRNTAEILR